MLKAVLFDIDNTLILYDEANFLRKYFPILASRFRDLVPEEKFAEKLMQATVVMQANDGGMSNRERFMGAFCRDTGWNWGDVWSRFEHFYLEDWDKLRDVVKTPEGSHDVFLEVRRRGLKTVIASNPIFPLQAQMRKLQWAGLGDIDFGLITHIDNMNYCKPHLGYFRQTCELAGLKPGECLMVGDDPANDMVAARVGMRTFQTCDGLEYQETPREVSSKVIGSDTEGIPPPDFKGPLACVTQALDSLLK